jgi:hypothetical protein
MRTRPQPLPTSLPAEAPPHVATVLAKLLPEVSVLLLVSCLLLAPEWAWMIHPESLMFVAIADGATLMMSATLVDIASRLKKPPPWWLAPLALGGILLAYPDAIEVLKLGWSLGLWVFLPFAWSIIERVREIWTLPLASPLERIRRRVLTFDRLYTGIVLTGLLIALMLVHVLLLGNSIDDLRIDERLPWLLLAFYGVSAANVVRVHRPRFARRPDSLWPRMDGGQGSSLDPL